MSSSQSGVAVMEYTTEKPSSGWSESVKEAKYRPTLRFLSEVVSIRGRMTVAIQAQRTCGSTEKRGHSISAATDACGSQEWRSLW